MAMGLTCFPRLCSCPVTPWPLRGPWSAAEKQVAKLLPLDPLSTAGGPSGLLLSQRRSGKRGSPGTCRPMAARTGHTASGLGASSSRVSVLGDRAAWDLQGQKGQPWAPQQGLHWRGVTVCLAVTVFVKRLYPELAFRRTHP